MIKLKAPKPINTQNSVSSRERQLRGLIPWRPGQSGNPGGRPRKVKEAIAEELDRIVTVTVKGEDGTRQRLQMPRVKAMALALVDNACSFEPHSVNAFRAIRETVEPTEKEENEIAASALHTTLLAGFLRIAQAKPVTDV